MKDILKNIEADLRRMKWLPLDPPIAPPEDDVRCLAGTLDKHTSRCMVTLISYTTDGVRHWDGMYANLAEGGHLVRLTPELAKLAWELATEVK